MTEIDLSPADQTLLGIMIGAALVTYAWRGLGVFLSGRMAADSSWFEWVGCVAYALLAGLIARMIILPEGPLAQAAAADRIGAAIFTLAIFYLTRRNLALGVIAGAGALILLTWGRAGFL
ncbi:MAG: AzlD domain-containing protein [Pseudomonadota bacterium]